MSAAPDFAVPAAAPPNLAEAFARDVLEGLSRLRKSIPCTWLYDRRGSELFELITGLPEYYPARTETWILERCAAEIAALAGEGATVIELGAGAAHKTRLLLAALKSPALYLPIDVSAEFLGAALAPLATAFPALRLQPVAADFATIESLPTPRDGRRIVFFPGSTIGNFSPAAAVALLARFARIAGPDALLVVGVDSTQDPRVLIPAYDDRHGITAAFNRNLLVRINRELDGRFEPSAFRHEARWNAHEQRIEMHLVAEYTQAVRVGGRSFWFERGESIHTENAYKHGVLRLQALARRAGWSQRQLWTDGASRFAVHVFDRA